MSMPVFLLFFVLLCSSCVKLEYMKEALVLQAYAREKDAQSAQVADQDQAFEALYQAACQGGSVENIPGKIEFEETFGRPALVLVSDQEEGERWLYRKATQYFGGSKIYVFFDADGKFEKVVCRKMP
jgi:hypothetical protein